MANREKDLRELKKFMDKWFELLVTAKTEDGKLCAMESIGLVAEDMISVVERGEA